MHTIVFLCVAFAMQLLNLALAAPGANGEIPRFISLRLHIVKGANIVRYLQLLYLYYSRRLYPQDDIFALQRPTPLQQPHSYNLWGSHSTKCRLLES